MIEASKWIKENITNSDKSDIRRRLKGAINFKTTQNELLEEESNITGKYTILGFSVKELGRTAGVMHGYEGDATGIYCDYLAQAITDRLRAVYEFDVLDEEDYDSLIAYGKFIMEEIEKFCTRDVYYTLEGLYKIFK
ncbi:hypothetical protein [uncultured Clostridium sp.]|uniref:hypothetical protein n=1 Tax=uncultured Clostridium sp. TaxID=59620 RepID=UPI002625385C|nr:hypothetical protein [uncultured Clostridium sp.]